MHTESANPRGLWIRYVLMFIVVACSTFVLVGYPAWFPSVVWVLLFYGIVLGGWMVTSLTSHHILAGALARRKTRMDPWMQVIATIAWSVGNLVLIGVIVTVLTLVLRPTP